MKEFNQKEYMQKYHQKKKYDITFDDYDENIIVIHNKIYKEFIQ